jgi:hypothetical protein
LEYASMSDTIKPTPPVYSNGPTFQRAGMRRNTVGGYVNVL